MYKMKRNVIINKQSTWNQLTSVLLFLSFIVSGTNLSAKTGDEIFNTNCFTCHALSDKTMTGPGLNGLLERRSPEWVANWIKNSQELINSGDKDAVAIFEEYNKILMPSYDFSDEEMADLIKYIEENGVSSDNAEATTSGGGSSNSASNDTAGSGINMQYVLYAIIAIIVALFFAYRFKTRVFREMNNLGVHADPHHVKNYPGIFSMYIIIAAATIFIIKLLLEGNYGMIDQLMFLALPYLALGIFLVGSIYRYKKKGFKVSSLSSQFLEGKKLFRGSQPFHWGLLVLFFGHLIAFLIPSAVIAWNGEPIRRLILELSSFAFALAALWGLIQLIIRRLSSKTLLVVTNKMDMVVYTILLTQIISGLGVAYYLRWGSSWFASVLTPYLRSVFSFDPDISAVAEMPWWIQLHIISAFSIIAIIPFTRFMHFLVAPVDYIWRKYQIVIWNWNRKAIRSSTRHTFGKKPRNH